MTKSFNRLFETLLVEMMPLGFEGGTEEVGGVIDEIVKNIMSSVNTTGHWVKVFTSKKLKGLSPEQAEPLVRELVTNVVKEVFPEHNNTYNPDIDKSQLRDKLKTAIRNAFEINATYSKFLSDRFGGKDLLGKAKDVVVQGLSKDIENSTESSGGGVELKAVEAVSTQKKEKEILKKYLSDKPKASAKTPKAAEDVSEKEMVYRKKTSFKTNDKMLKAVHQALPDYEMDWGELLEKIKSALKEHQTYNPEIKIRPMSTAEALKDAGGLTEEEKEIEASEDKKVPELDADDDDDDVNTNVTAARLAARMMGEFGPGGYKVPRRGSDDYTGYGGGYGGYED